MEKNRRISVYIKDMMKKADIPIKDAAAFVGVSVGTFRNKLTQDRFSVDDLIIIAEMCDYHLTLLPNVEAEDCVTKSNLSAYILDIEDQKLKEEIENYKEDKFDEMMGVLQSYVQHLSPEQLKKLFDSPKKK